MKPRIRHNLPILMHRQTTTSDRQKHSSVRHEHRAGQVADICLHAQARGQPAKEEQHAELQGPNESRVAIPSQHLQLRAGNDLLALGVGHARKLGLGEVDIGSEAVCQVDCDGVADVAEQDNEGDVVVSAEVSDTNCSRANSEPR